MVRTSSVESFVPEITSAKLNLAITGDPDATSELLPLYSALISRLGEDVIEFGVAIVKHVDDNRTTVKPYHCVTMTKAPVDKQMLIIEGDNKFYCCVDYDPEYKTVLPFKFSSNGEMYGVAKITNRNSNKYIIFMGNILLNTTPKPAPKAIAPAPAPAAKPEYKVHPSIQECIDDFRGSSRYAVVDVVAGNKEIKITFISPEMYRSSHEYDRCRDGKKCTSFSCSRHSFNEKYAIYQIIAYTEWDVNDYNYQLAKSAGELCKLFKYYSDNPKKNNGEVNARLMRRALLSMVPKGAAFNVK